MFGVYRPELSRCSFCSPTAPGCGLFTRRRTTAELLYPSLPKMMWASDLQREDFLVWAYNLHCFLPNNGGLEVGHHRQPAMVVSLFRAGPNYTSGSPARRNFQILLVGLSGIVLEITIDKAFGGVRRGIPRPCFLFS